jgi:hypothetical protein
VRAVGSTGATPTVNSEGGSRGRYTVPDIARDVRCDVGFVRRAMLVRCCAIPMSVRAFVRCCTMPHGARFVARFAVRPSYDSGTGPVVRD